MFTPIFRKRIIHGSGIFTFVFHQIISRIYYFIFYILYYGPACSVATEMIHLKSAFCYISLNGFPLSKVKKNDDFSTPFARKRCIPVRMIKL